MTGQRHLHERTVTAALAAGDGHAAGLGGVMAAGIPGPGKSGIVTRYAEQWLRDHPGGMVEVRDLKAGPVDALQEPALDASDAGIARQALPDAAAWRAWKAEGANCGECARLDPGRCAEHAADEDLAAAYKARRDCLPGGDDK